MRCGVAIHGPVVTDWTPGEGHAVLALAVPVTGGGMIVARIDGAAIGELFGKSNFRMSVLRIDSQGASQRVNEILFGT